MVEYMVIIQNKGQYSYAGFVDVVTMYEYLKTVVFNKVEIFKIV